jgi:hypothetical protein
MIFGEKHSTVCVFHDKNDVAAMVALRHARKIPPFNPIFLSPLNPHEKSHKKKPFKSHICIPIQSPFELKKIP